jgi:hypothetical protein
VAANRPVVEAMAAALEEAESLEGEGLEGFLARVRSAADDGLWSGLERAEGLALVS